MEVAGFLVHRSVGVISVVLGSSAEVCLDSGVSVRLVEDTGYLR